MNQVENRSSFAAVAVRLAGLWILTGAVAKLLVGTPKDLPQLVRDLVPIDLDLKFHLVISVELAIVCLAMLKPKLAWPVVLALFAFFDFILISQLRAGADSCGCFGATIKVSPWLMLGIDSALILALLASRPWATLAGPVLGGGRSTLLLLAGFAVSGAVPWIVIRAPGADSPTPPRYYLMDPAKWVGKSIDQLPELLLWVPLEKVPTDGRIVLWRQGCEHCALHLQRMAEKNDPSVAVLLLQIRDDLTAGRAVTLMPQGDHVTSLATPENQQIVVTTPVEVVVGGAVVTEVIDAETLEAEDKKD